MVVKYGVSYKQCRQFAKDVFTASDKTVDVDELWKQHKKHAQKNTTVALYGVEHTAMREEVQEKRRMTNRKVYGADNPMQNPEIKEKLRTRILAEHGVDYTFMKRTAIPTWLNKKPKPCFTECEREFEQGIVRIFHRFTCFILPHIEQVFNMCVL